MRLVFANQEPHLEPNPNRELMSGVPAIAENTLNRHGGRVLRPLEADRAPDQPMPVGTIYRYDRLLVDESLTSDEQAMSSLEAAIQQSGRRLDCQAASAIVESQGSRRVPISLSGHGTVDAWSALQSLRAAANSGELDSGIVDRIGLEHLLVCSKGGSPSTAETEPPVPGQLRSLGRIPVDMVNPMPPRRPVDRRVRVAVLDTGVPKAHPAFDISDRAEGLDTFVVVDHDFQRKFGERSDSHVAPLDTPWDGPVHEPGHIKDVASHFGHGTFMTGLLRQMSPDIQVYSLRIVHNDGLTYEHEMVAAMHHVADETEAARGGDESAMGVDIVVLAIGYVDEDPDDAPASWMKAAVDRLTALGIPVVAAAGNQSSDRPFYPAALAGYPRPETAAPVLSVASLNPNRTVSMFSNDGPWISCFATGAGLVSTFPCDADGSLTPDRQSYSEIDRERESHDPDDFYSGFAVWSGTSFAAPVAAGFLANELTDSGVPPEAVVDSTQAAAWVHGALKRLKSR